MTKHSRARGRVLGSLRVLSRPGKIFRLLVVWAGFLSAGALYGGPAEDSRLAQRVFYVQLSAFQDLRNAERFNRQLKKKGYSPYLVTVKKGKVWHKIVLGPYPDKNRAHRILRSLNHREKLQGFIISGVFTGAVAGPPPEDRSPVPRHTAVENSPETAARPLTIEETPSPGKRADFDSIDVVVSLFLGWKKAWQEKNLYTYLEFYSRDFRPHGKSLEEWKKSRIQALMQNNQIRIEFNDIKILQGDGIVEMTFVQNYSSDLLSDRGEKTLVWKKDGEDWKIIKETWKSI